MDAIRSLADPSFEPTDEDLGGLVARAFAQVKDAQDASLRKLRTEIAAAREIGLARLQKRKSNVGTSL